MFGPVDDACTDSSVEIMKIVGQKYIQCICNDLNKFQA